MKRPLRKRPSRRLLLGLSNLGFVLAALLALLPLGMSTYGRWEQSKEQREFQQELASNADFDDPAPPPVPDLPLTSRGSARHRPPATSTASTSKPPRAADSGTVSPASQAAPPPVKPAPPSIAPPPQPAPEPGTAPPPAPVMAPGTPTAYPAKASSAARTAKPRPAPARKRPSPPHRRFRHARLQIPSIGVDAIVSDMKGDWGNWKLFTGPVREPASSPPGERGNCVIAAHRNMWDATFADLPQVRPGDRAVITTPYGRYTYRIDSSRLTHTSDLSPLRPSRDPRLTLYTCILPYNANRRWVVQAHLVAAREKRT